MVATKMKWDERGCGDKVSRCENDVRSGKDDIKKPGEKHDTTDGQDGGTMAVLIVMMMPLRAR